ncbi:MAG: tetratricopeptide repeat protein [Polyangiaceae bacterium]|nr:tetratricopeptide repeat protein [Polyangiaceae bacterium]
MACAGLALALASACLGAGVARAQDAVDARVRAAARELGADGMQLFDRGQYADALDRFERANKLIPAPTLQLRAARCLVKLGRLVEASERYLDATRMDLPGNALPVHFKARREAQKERDELLPTLPKLTIELEGPGTDVTVRLDGQDVPAALLGAPQPVDPGRHEIVAARGDAEATRSIAVKPGELATVRLRAPRPGEASSSEAAPLTAWERAAVVTMVAGGGLVVLGAVNGLAALAQHASLADRCPDRVCPPDASGAVDVYDATRVWTTLGLVTGGLALATGTVLFFTEPSVSRSEGDVDDDVARRSRLELGVGPGGAVLRGRF